MGVAPELAMVAVPVTDSEQDVVQVSVLVSVQVWVMVMATVTVTVLAMVPVPDYPVVPSLVHYLPDPNQEKKSVREPILWTF
jgi:hypothetical protein